MDYRTAAAASQNIASIADAFMQMNDPATRAKAGLLRGSIEEQRLRNEALGIGNRYAPEQAQSGIDLTRARTATEAAQQGYLNAGAGERDSAADINRLRLSAGREMLGGAASDGVLPPRDDSAASAFMTPFTTYSRGGDAGPDEMTDKWTEKGYSSTGRNLTPGMAAVNPSRHPIGTIFKNPQTGEVFIAADKHGNGNPEVVDLYRDPADYKAESGRMPLEVVGQEKIPYGTTPEQLQAIRDRYSRVANIFAQGGADDLAQAQARNAMLAAGDNEQAGRNAAAAISGNLPGTGEYSTPGAAAAFQAAGIGGQLQQEGMRQEGLTQRKALDIAYGGTGSRGSSAGSAGGGASGIGMVKPVHEMVAARFGMMTDNGPVVSPEMSRAAGSWQTTYANLVDSGVSPVKAEVIADQHHQVANVKEEDPWFGAPRMVAGEGFNPIPLTPDEARAYAPAPAAGVPELPDIMTLLYGTRGGAGAPADSAPAQTRAPVAAVAPSGSAAELFTQPVPASQTAEPVPQTGTPERGPMGKRLGTERLQAEGTAWNSGTLGNALRVVQQSGVPIEDLIATAFAGDDTNDQEISRIFVDASNRGIGIKQQGGFDANHLRNALLDERALAAAGIDPAKVRAYLAGVPQGGQAPARRYNPATGKIDPAALFEMYRPK